MRVDRLLVAAVLAVGLALGAVGCGGQSSASHSTTVVATYADAPATKEETAAESTPGAEPAGPVVAPAEPAPPVAPAQTKDDAPQPPQKKRLPADRQPRKPGDAEKITFDDLNLGMPQDIVFRPFMLTDRVKELEGQRVSLIGYMHGGQVSPKSIKEFVLLKNTECKFGPGGQADHLGRIYLKDGLTTKYSLEPVKVEGTLKVNPFTGTDNNTWSVYDLTDATAELAR